MPPADGLDGVLVVDKPSGPTSHDVVDHVRRRLRQRRVGHTGTLDPLASGVLALVLGRATRLARFLAGDIKRYEASIRLGGATDSYDAQGVPLPPPWRGSALTETDGAGPSGAALDRESVERALSRFVGPTLQKPPAFSAKRVAGERAYARARQADPLDLAEVPVRVHALRLLSADADRVRLELACSAGFYVRSLAHDLGILLGTGAHLEALRRTASGDFSIEDAVPLAEVAERGGTAVVPCRHLLRHLPAVRLAHRDVVRVGHGQAIQATAAPAGMAAADLGSGTGVDERWWRLLDDAGELIAVAKAAPEGGVLQPVVVLI